MQIFIPTFFGLDDSGCTQMGNLPHNTVVSGKIQFVDVRSNTIIVRAELGHAVFTDAQLQACDELVGKGQQSPLLNGLHSSVRTYRFHLNDSTVTPDANNPPTKAGWALLPN